MILALDIGGTFIKWAVADGYELSRQGKVKTPRDTLDSLIDAIRKLLSENSGESITGLAVSYPGMCAPSTGIVLPIGSLEYIKGIPLQRELEEALSLPMVLENDGRCAAIAEARLGNLRGVHSGYVLVIGTGVGGSYVRDGEILRGSHGYAGQISLMLTGELRTNGLDALLASQIGMEGLLKRAADALNCPGITGEKFMELVEQGNPAAEKVFDDCMNLFSCQLFSLQMLYDPERFLIGGGISANGRYVGALREKYEELYNLYQLNIPRADILPCKFRNTSNLMGALALYYDQYPA